MLVFSLLSVEIYADKSTGYINIEASGGDGRQAQDGAKGHVGSRANRVNVIYGKQASIIILSAMHI